MQDFTFKMIEDGTFSVTAYQGNDSEVVIPDTYCGKPVTVLFDNLFRGHSEITSVTIPDTVTDIGAAVFDGCERLTSLTLPKALVNMWQYAFARSSIEELELPEGVTNIVPFTFKDCKRLRRLKCADTLEKISSWAFQGCGQLTELTVPPTASVSPKAFE